MIGFLVLLMSLAIDGGALGETGHGEWNVDDTVSAAPNWK